MMDLRGTGRSQGCLDHLGPNDARDIKQVVEWAASQPWSNGSVGMTGHSYVGSTPAVAAAQNPRGLATIVPSAGLASMYDHQFQAGVPYYLQWAGPIEAYEQLALERKLPRVPGPVRAAAHRRRLRQLARGHRLRPAATRRWSPARTSSPAATPTGTAQRDWRGRRDRRAQIPVFLVHGVNDNAARVARDAVVHRPRAAAPATSCGSASGTTARAAARTAAATSGPTRCTRGSTRQLARRERRHRARPSRCS